jgi:DNA-binding HxlR family transcriptional regulator
VLVREVEASSPVRVRYALTDKGRALEEVVAGVERWAHDWLAPADHAHEALR